MSSAFTKHQQIIDAITQRIDIGVYPPGKRIPRDEDFAKEFDASRPTVAKAMQELVKTGLLVRKRGSGTYVQQFYSSSRQFGLLIPGLGETEILDPICAQMARSAQINRHSLLWGANMPRQSAPEDRGKMALELSRIYVKQRVGGVFFAPLELASNSLEVNGEIIDQFREARIPIVLLDRDYMPYPQRSEYDLVGIDNRRVGYTITQHLIESGSRRPVFIAKPNSAATVDARFAGFTEALMRNDIEFANDLNVHWRAGDEHQLRQVVGKFDPDGFVCGNDATAAQLLSSLEAIGVEVPNDVIVTGIDDVRFAELLRVPLTTIRQPCDAIGQAAFQTMLNRINFPDTPAQEVLLGCQIVVRRSTERFG